MDQQDYVDLGPYGMYKSLRLYNCPKVNQHGEVNANSRYQKPDNIPGYKFMITCTHECFFV